MSRHAKFLPASPRRPSRRARPSRRLQPCPNACVACTLLCARLKRRLQVHGPSLRVLHQVSDIHTGLTLADEDDQPRVEHYMPLLLPMAPKLR